MPGASVFCTCKWRSTCVQKREKINLVEVVKHATEIFTESYISFHTSAEIIQANLDKMQITRVITNLLKNATQAVEEVKTPTIEVKVVEENLNVIITVADNGKGMSDEVKEKIFEPKFTTKSSGMGLGLPMVKNIIQAYDGTISFTTQDMQGTVFKIVLPKE